MGPGASGGEASELRGSPNAELRAATPVVVVTHGTWGALVVETAECFLGPQDRLASVSLNLTDSPEGLAEKLNRALSDLGIERGLLFLVDLRGGTPWNVVAALSRKTESHCVAGLNLPMLLEVLLRRSELLAPELAEVALATGREGIVSLAALLAGGPR